MTTTINNKHEFDEFLDMIEKNLEVIEHSNLPENEKKVLYRAFETSAYWAIQYAAKGTIPSSLDIMFDGLGHQDAHFLSEFGIRVTLFQKTNFAQIKFPRALLELDSKDLESVLSTFVPPVQVHNQKNPHI